MTSMISSTREYTISSAMLSQAIDEEEDIVQQVIPEELKGESFEKLHCEFLQIKADFASSDLHGSSDDMMSYACKLRGRVDAAVEKFFSHSDGSSLYSSLDKDLSSTSFSFPSYSLGAAKGAVIGAFSGYTAGRPSQIQKQTQKLIQSAGEWLSAEKKAQHLQELHRQARANYKAYLESRMPDVKPKSIKTTPRAIDLHQREISLRSSSRMGADAAKKAQAVVQQQGMKLSRIPATTAGSVMKRAAFGGAMGALVSIILEPSIAE